MSGIPYTIREMKLVIEDPAQVMDPYHRDLMKWAVEQIELKREKHSVIMLSSLEGDWEGLFIDGKLISQEHHLGEGRPQRFWLDIATKYGVSGDDLKRMEVTDEDNEDLCDRGDFPSTLAELKGDYLSGEDV